MKRCFYFIAIIWSVIGSAYLPANLNLLLISITIMLLIYTILLNFFLCFIFMNFQFILENEKCFILIKNNPLVQLSSTHLSYILFLWNEILHFLIHSLNWFWLKKRVSHRIWIVTGQRYLQIFGMYKKKTFKNIEIFMNIMIYYSDMIHSMQFNWWAISVHSSKFDVCITSIGIGTQIWLWLMFIRWMIGSISKCCLFTTNVRLRMYNTINSKKKQMATN